MRAAMMVIGLIAGGPADGLRGPFPSTSKRSGDRGDEAPHRTGLPARWRWARGRPTRCRRRRPVGPARRGPVVPGRGRRSQPPGSSCAPARRASRSIRWRPAMAELRRIVQRVGGFVADASVQSGRNQLRSATLAAESACRPVRRADRRARAAGRAAIRQRGGGGRERGVRGSDRPGGERPPARGPAGRAPRTRTGKLQDVLTVERELARVREEIERMEGRMRFLKTSAQLSTLSVNLTSRPRSWRPTRAAASSARHSRPPGATSWACWRARSPPSASWCRRDAGLGSTGPWARGTGGRRRERDDEQ